MSEPKTTEGHDDTYDAWDQDACQSCGSDEHVYDGLCCDCAADIAEWRANQDWDY